MCPHFEISGAIFINNERNRDVSTFVILANVVFDKVSAGTETG